jgi:hypothetical protein
MKERLATKVSEYLELQRRLGCLEGGTISRLILAASVEKAADRIAESIDSLEIVIRTKKPEGL